jgi:drug/metabolite transporter (DMT)-like permease
MINFLLCILCNSGIFLTFRLFKSKGINTPMAITINYLVAACFGWLQAGGFEAMQESTSKPWFITTAIMGTGFLFLFNLMAKCTREFGVSIATMSTKLSMVIPISVFLIIHPEDQITLAKAIAISLAFLTIILSSNNSKEERKSRLDLLMPMIIFLGSGGIDLVFGLYSGEEFMQRPSDPYALTSIPFTVAFITGIAARSFPQHRHKLRIQDFWGGALLGIINFGSLYFLLKAFSDSGLDNSSVIPSLNVSVIILSTITALLLFKEKPSTKTWIGLALGCISISLFLLF